MANEVSWGERGDFRKLTVTLPPEVYDALVQESARRKTAGEANHLLSAIAREWFVQRQPLLPIEKAELKIYRAIDGVGSGRGDWWFLQNIYTFRQQIGDVTDKILVDLLVDIAARGWILLEKFSHDTNRYLPFSHWQDEHRFFFERGDVRLQLTIPGRRRKETLEVKEPRPTNNPE
jgi:hypothetical protein